jgi:hypothetical protein
MTEDRGQRTEDRRQRIEDRRQKAEDRRQSRERQRPEDTTKVDAPAFLLSSLAKSVGSSYDSYVV